MKAILIIILIFAFALPSSAELTENDLRRIIREEIEPVKKVFENRIGQLEIKVAAIEAKMATKEYIITTYQKLSDKIDSLYAVMIAALVTIIVVIAIPQILIEMLHFAQHERRESRLSKEVDELKQIIAELKGKKVISP